MQFQEAKDKFRTAIMKMVGLDTGEPVKCPMCDTYHKVYKRNVTSTMARELIAFYRVNRNRFGHITGINSRGGDFAKLRLWGLIEQAPDSYAMPIGGKSNSYWRVTAYGYNFINGHTSIKKYKHVLNGTVVGDSGDHLTIHDCLGNRFNYDELMRR